MFSPAVRISAPPRDALTDVLTGTGLRAVYQPIVDLDDGAVVGYEALARGPVGSALERPDQLFGAARATGRVAELDRACRRVAMAGAVRAGMAAPLTLFVNVEPSAVGEGPPEDPPDPALRIIVELTERELASRPADLLAAVSRIRRRGWGIALDDVGADRRSLAFLPFLRPDVIKLDLRLIQARPSSEIAEVAGAVSAAAERTDSVVLAEGIETPEHLDVARALGARLGQGYLFGRPGDITAVAPGPKRPIPLRDLSAPPPATTPFASVAALRPPRRSTKPLLWQMSQLLESQAADLGATGVVLACFQDRAFFTPATARRYAALAERLSLVAALGQGLEARPVGAVRGASLEPGDPLLDEWNIVAVGPHFAGALVARDLGDDGPDAERRFDFVLTYDRSLVLEAARATMARVAPE